jgi:TPR repeat protein
MAFTDIEIAQTREAASQQGAPEDLYKLGLIYSTGHGAEIDLIQAHMWFNLAALRGSQSAKECRKELSDQMTTAEIAAAQRAAREWLNQTTVH